MEYFLHYLALSNVTCHVTRLLRHIHTRDLVPVVTLDQIGQCVSWHLTRLDNVRRETWPDRTMCVLTKSGNVRRPTLELYPSLHFTHALYTCTFLNNNMISVVILEYNLFELSYHTLDNYVLVAGSFIVYLRN